MYGTNVAPDLWLNYISRKLFNIPGVCVFLYDIEIQGESLKQHLMRLKLVLADSENVIYILGLIGANFLKTP